MMNDKFVCILDYGSGNIRSVYNLIASLTKHVSITADPELLLKATHIVLPGVGAFDSVVTKVRKKIPLDTLNYLVLEKKIPFLGICAGMQILADVGNEYGCHQGLAWISGTVDRLNSGSYPLPHVGWNDVLAKQNSAILTGLGENPDFYFVHSYSFQPEDAGTVIAVTNYGSTFCSIVQCGNIIGVQFHPEKSQRAGQKLMKNFLEIR